MNIIILLKFIYMDKNPSPVDPEWDPVAEVFNEQQAYISL